MVAADGPVGCLLGVSSRSYRCAARCERGGGETAEGDAQLGCQSDQNSGGGARDGAVKVDDTAVDTSYGRRMGRREREPAASTVEARAVSRAPRGRDRERPRPAPSPHT